MQAVRLGQIESFDFSWLKIEPGRGVWCDQRVRQHQAAEHGLQVFSRAHCGALGLYAGVEPIQNFWHARPQAPTLGNQFAFHWHQTYDGPILDLNTGHVDANRCSSRAQLRELRARAVHEQSEA